MTLRRKNDFEGFSIGSWISGWINKIRHKLLEGLGQDDFDRQSPAGTGVLHWLSFPFRVVWAFLGFLLTTWSSTRPANSFGRAMPAILVTAGFVGILVLAYTIPFRIGGLGFPDPAVRYENRTIFLRELGNTETNPAEKKELLEGSLVCARHLVSIRPKNESYKYLLGIALAQNEDLPGARSVMEFIAPINEKGMSMAHIWLAFDLLNTDAGESAVTADTSDPADTADTRLSTERRELAFSHLKKIEESSANDETVEGHYARIRMAALLINDKRYDEATSLLQTSVEKSQLRYPVQLEAIVLLANVYKAQYDEADGLLQSSVMGQLRYPVQQEPIVLLANVYKSIKKDQLISFVSAALQKLTEFTLRQPDTAEIWEAMVTLNVVMDDVEQKVADGEKTLGFQSASLLLRDGIVATRDPEVRKRLMQLQNVLFIRQSQLVPEIDSRENYIDKFKILANAIMVNPMVPDVYIAILPYLDVRRPNTDESIWLREIFLEPDAPGAVLHAVIGMREILGGRFAEGQGQWLIAQRKMETAGIMINNFIQVLVEKKPEDLEIIYNLASVAIETFPDQYFFYYTRGKILKKLNRAEQAGKDLEIVINKIPEAIEPRQLMIEIQEQLGNTDIVEKLRREIQEIEAKGESDRRRDDKTPN